MKTKNEKYVDFLKKIFKCKHSFIECRGLGGGWKFEYCNKCGITKSILDQLNKI